MPSGDLMRWAERTSGEARRGLWNARERLCAQWEAWRVRDRWLATWELLQRLALQGLARTKPWLEKRSAELGNRDTWALTWARTRFRFALLLSWLGQGRRRYWVPATFAFLLVGGIGVLTRDPSKGPSGERALGSEPNPGGPSSPDVAAASPVTDRKGVDISSLPVLSPAPSGTRDPRFAVRTPVSRPSCDDALGAPFRAEPTANPAMAGEFWTKSRRSLLKGNPERALGEMCRAAAWDLAGRGSYGLSEYYFREGDFAQSLAWAERVPAGSKRFVDARSMIGDVYSQLGQSDAALEAFLRGSNVSATDVEGRRQLAARFALSAASAQRKRDHWTAERFFRRALTLDPKNADAAAGLSRVLLRFQETAAAAGWAEEALALDGNSSLGALALCEARIAEKDRSGAREAFARLQKLAPEEPNLGLLRERIEAL